MQASPLSCFFLLSCIFHGGFVVIVGKFKSQIMFCHFVTINPLASPRSHQATLQLKKEQILGKQKTTFYFFAFNGLLYNAKCQSVDAWNWDRLALNSFDKEPCFMDRVPANIILSMTMIQNPGKGSPGWPDLGTLGSFLWLMFFHRWHFSWLPCWYIFILWSYSQSYKRLATVMAII